MDLAGKLTLDAPFQQIGHAWREADVEHFDGVGVGECAELDGRGIDERVGPGKFEFVHTFAEREEARLFHEREVGGVVDRELHGVAARQGDDVDARLNGRSQETEASSQKNEWRFHVSSSPARCLGHSGGCS